MQYKKFHEGYTKVPNKILEALLHARFSARERKVIDLFLRFGYGCGNKREIVIKKTELAALCNIPKQDVNRVLSGLFEKGVFTYNKVCKRLVFFGKPELWKFKSCGSTCSERRARLVSALIHRSLKVRKLLTKKCVKSALRVRKLRTFETSFPQTQAEKSLSKEIYIKEILNRKEMNNLKIKEELVFNNPQRIEEMLSVWRALGCSPKNPDMLILRAIRSYGEERVLEAFESIKENLPPDYWIAYKRLYDKIHER